MRLADGAREGEGRVEIFRDGHWGTVCDDHWDTHDADVVCRMLNYSRALRAPRQAFFGRGNGKIWLSNIHCVGNETSILQCAHQDWGVNNCDHHEDASVICERETANLGKQLKKVNASLYNKHKSTNIIVTCSLPHMIVFWRKARKKAHCRFKLGRQLFSSNRKSSEIGRAHSWSPIFSITTMIIKELDNKKPCYKVVIFCQPPCRKIERKIVSKDKN